MIAYLKDVIPVSLVVSLSRQLSNLLNYQYQYGWAHKHELTHLSLVHSPGPSVVLCALSIAIVLYKIHPLLDC